MALHGVCAASPETANKIRKKQKHKSLTNKHRAWVRSVGLETHATAGREAGATVSCFAGRRSQRTTKNETRAKTLTGKNIGKQFRKQFMQSRNSQALMKSIQTRHEYRPAGSQPRPGSSHKAKKADRQAGQPSRDYRNHALPSAADPVACRARCQHTGYFLPADFFMDIATGAFLCAAGFTMDSSTGVVPVTSFAKVAPDGTR